MNDKFFKLPLEKQRRIINAAYKVFSENSYKKPQCQKLQTRAVFQKRCFSTTLQTKRIIFVPMGERY